MSDFLASTNEIMGKAILASTNEIDIASEIVDAIKADPDLGTTGLIADAALAAAEIQKVHRSATAVAGGAAMRRTASAATSTTLDETLGPTP